MDAPKLPALRLTAEGQCLIQEGVSLDLPPSNKFSVSYAPSEGRQNSMGTTSTGTPSPKENSSGFSSSEGEEESSDENEGGDREAQYAQSNGQQSFTSAPSNSTHSSFRMSSIPERPGPHMSRTFSMPLPSQLNHLQNPHRPSPLNSYQSSPMVPSTHEAGLSSASQVREVSVELADSIQLVVQTMLQLSPPQLLDPAKEQFSAYALSVPTSSMSALFNAMKNINYISANMSSFCDIQPPTHSEGSALSDESVVKSGPHNDFDIGEMLQCAGDVLSGAAAQAGVDLVLYHGDVGLKHVYVSGDEGSISFALSHIVRQVLNTAERGDTIEIGLLITPLSSPPRPAPSVLEPPPVDDLLGAAPLESNGPIRVTIRISHKYAPSDTHQGDSHPKDVVTTEFRQKPTFSALLLRRILGQIGGSLISDLPPPESFTSGRTCELEMVLDRVSAPLPTDQREDEEGGEPSIEQLSSFGETLKGKRVALYASAKGSFAHHLTSYLTAWGMDVAHVSPDGQVDGSTEHTMSSPQPESRVPAYNLTLATYTESGSSHTLQPTKDPRPSGPQHPSLIFIDDDVDILKERLQAIRFENQPQPSLLNSRKRPSLSANHRPRSSPQMARLMNLNNLSRQPTPVVIMHFTSLAKYKQVKDVMQSLTAAYAATATPLPEVMIIPKPAGPRRFLTAMHSAITKPTVDPFFIPIATSPMTPSQQQQAGGSFFGSPISEHGGHIGNASNHGSTNGSQTHLSSSKNSNRPHGSRSNSDRSTKSADGVSNAASVMPPSPLAYPDNVEYFSAAAQKLGSTPSSGLVIQSPDGQTAGIYFHPRSKTITKKPSTDRDRMTPSLSGSRRGSVPRIPSGGKKEDTVTFSSLHQNAHLKAPGFEARPARSPGTVASATSSPSAGPSTWPTPIAGGEPAGPSSEKANGSGPLEDQNQQPPTVSQPLSRRASDDIRKLGSPVTSPSEGASTPNRRLGKRPAADSKDSSTSVTSKQKGKTGALGDANVVPPISVLIVDDNPINQTILSTFMRRKKIKYDLASNGQEAVQKWRTGGFHLILMDIQMPVMDGIQATKEIRRLEKSNANAGFPPLTPSTEESQTPSEKSAPSASSEGRSLNSPYRSSVIIVALTASSLQSDRVAALAAGCNDFLTKPVSLLWLNNKIIEWGSIKALQMWADIRPDAVRSLANGQAQQARNVAERLHVPKGRITPSPSRRSASAMEDNAAAIALASSAGLVPSIPNTSAMNLVDRPISPATAATDATLNGVDFALDKSQVRKSSAGSVEADDTPKPSTPTSRTFGADVETPRKPKSPSMTPVPKHFSQPPEMTLTAATESGTALGNGITNHLKEENLQSSPPPLGPTTGPVP